MKTKNIVTILLLSMCILLLNCDSSLLFKYTKTKPAKLKLHLNLTSPDQQIVIDSVSSIITKRLLIISDYRKDFILVKEGESYDYLFELTVRQLKLISKPKQVKISQKRKKMEKKLEKAKDSISGGRIAASNIAANFISNLILNPLGYMSITIITDESIARGRNPKIYSAIDSTISTALLSFDLQVKNNNNRIISRNDIDEYFTLTYIIPIEEQLSVLTRNFVMNLEDHYPFFKVR